MTDNQQRAAEVYELITYDHDPEATIARALDAAEARGRAEVAARLSNPDPHQLAQAIYEAGCISGVAWEAASIWAKGKAERQARAVLDVLDIAAEVAW
jgi:hypothetical protein